MRPDDFDEDDLRGRPDGSMAGLVVVVLIIVMAILVHGNHSPPPKQTLHPVPHNSVNCPQPRHLGPR